MKAIFTLLILLIPFVGFGQMDIATARQQAENSEVTVTGVVTNGDELGSPIRYIEDGTAGIAIYDPENTEGVNRGDSITVTGILVDYNGLLEIYPVNNLIIHGSGYSITPQLIMPNDIGESTEAELVSIENVIFENAGQYFGVGLYNFNVGDQSGVIYVKSGCNIENSLIPTSEVKITAISSQYSFTGVDGYQLLIRDTNDIEFYQDLIIDSEITQNNITTSSFTVNWTSNLESYSNINYGHTPELELGEINDADNVISTNHSISLENLEAGTIYYVQAFSNIEEVYTYSSIYTFATQSTSSGEIRVCFNNPVDTTVGTIENAQYSGLNTNDSIKAYIDKAMHTLDVAIYNHSDILIANAINDAYDRGVRVRYITCESTTNTALSALNNNIPTLGRPLDVGIMHNKFIIIDADSADNAWILSGSTNWTSSQILNDPNHIIMIQDQSVARAYELEFNEMWGSDLEQPNLQNAKFGSDKTINTPHHFIVNGNDFEVYFSPTDNTTSNISNALQSADNEIDFALNTFTNNQLGAIIAEQYESGVEVNGIIGLVNVAGSEYEFLLDEGVNVISHEGFGDNFHHKYCIVDHANIDSDPLVITGSHNWSGASETINDENTMIIHDANIANQFYQEFNKRVMELQNPCDITPTGLYVDNIIHNRIRFNWSQPEVSPSHYMIRYREVGTNNWTVIAAGPQTPSPFNGTSRTRYFMEPETTYEWNIRARVLNEDLSINCQSDWSETSTYTTLPACANLEILSVSTEATWVTFFADAPDESWGVWQSKGKIREVGLNNYRYVNGDNSGNINGLKGNFTANTDYEWHTKAWCTGNVDGNGNSDPQYHSGWGEFSAFTTEELCDKLPINLSTSTNGANTAVIMSWDSPLSGNPDHYFLEMTNNTSGAVYQWNNIPGANNSKTKFNQSPGDEISWRIRGACGTNGTSWATIFTQPTVYTLGGEKLQRLSLNSLEIYPNPSRDVFNIKLSTENTQQIEIRVVNSIVQEIYREKVEVENMYAEQIDLSNYSKGIYNLTIKTSDGISNHKLILQ
jgi:phosphatidylserine/phosphatidylglycerophosphate/cardiolipin synthase-like enzyme